MSLAATTEKPNATNTGRQVLLRALLGLVLVPTLLVWVGVGSAFFGYRLVGVWGTSMEPVLRNGDALWVKQLNIADVKVGDIVVLVPPDGESITHRVVKIEPISKGSYSLVTKGDANCCPEEWEWSSDWTVALALAHAPFGGYVMEFLNSIFGRALIVVALVTLVVIWLRRRRMTHVSG